MLLVVAEHATVLSVLLMLRPFEVALFFNAVPFNDADTAARSFLRPLHADALRSFHTLGAPLFNGAGEPLFKVVRPFEDAVRSYRRCLPSSC